MAVTFAQFDYLWAMRHGTLFIHYQALAQDVRPYVYRLLLPSLARGLAWITGLDPGACLLALFILSAVGLYFSLKYLYRSFWPDDRSASVVAFAGSVFFFMLIFIHGKSYDPATGMFFSLALALLARQKFGLYYLLFPLATLNRETTFLLLPLFAILYRDRLAGLAYQVVVYSVLKILVMLAFADFPGEAFLFRPAAVIDEYLSDPARSLGSLAIFSLMLWLVFRRWEEKPALLRVAFLTIAPALLALHFLMGFAFEFRVLAEGMPAAFLLATAPRTIESTKPQNQ